MSVKETDFMCSLEAATRMKMATPVVVIFFTIIAFLAFFFIWAGVTEIEELTRGQGQVVPSQEIQVVQSLEGGIVKEILIKKGDLVRQGQVLLRISDVLFSSEQRGAEARFLGLEAKKVRLTAEAKGTPFDMPKDIMQKAPKISNNEKALYDSRQRELHSAYAIQDDRVTKAKADLAGVRAEINGFSQSRKLLKKELSIIRDMVAKRAVPKMEQLRLERELADISGKINARIQEEKGLKAVLSSAKNERKAQSDKFKSLAWEELNEVETQIATLKEGLKSMGDRVDRTEIRAPVDGIVNQIMIQTIGGIVEPAMRLIEIVPIGDELKIIAKIQPNEIAFLKIGQPVKVKITAYDPQKYGSLDGTLLRIAANSATDREGNVLFEIEVRTERNYLGNAEHPLPITSGMIANVEVITGKRTILNYLMKPLRRGFDRALRER